VLGSRIDPRSYRHKRARGKHALAGRPEPKSSAGVLEGRLKPIVGETLFLEYEAVLSRRRLFLSSPLSPGEREELFAAFLSVTEWVQVYYSWRPNLPDEGDNHIVELAVAGGASMIVTQNVRDFRRGSLRFPQVRVIRPKELLEEVG
jgi:uncharacterized protein